MPRGDGGFVALAVTCALYERFATAFITKSGTKADEQAKLRQFMRDFDTDDRTARVFWKVIRDGLAHQAMPLQKDRDKDLPPWWFHHSHTKAVKQAVLNGKEVLKVQPWHFMNKVLLLWQQHFALLAEGRSFPWGSIVGM